MTASKQTPELWQLAIGSREGDAQATTIIAGIAQAWHKAPPAEVDVATLKPYTYRMQPILDRIEENAVPSLMALHFEIAAQLQNQLNAAYPAVPLHGNLHHWNIVHNGTDWEAKLAPNSHVMGPEIIDLANTITNPYDPSPSLDMDPNFVLNKPRMERQIAVAAEATGWDKGDLAHGVFLHAVQVAARRVHGTPEGQVPLPYWHEAAHIAAQIANIRLDKGFVAVLNGPAQK